MLIATRQDPELLVLFEASGRNVERAALLLRDLLSDYPEHDGQAQALVQCELDGDRLAHEILRRLARHGARRPFADAADVHALAGALDDVVDYAEECADRLLAYGVEAPTVQAQEIAEVLVEAAAQVAAALGALKAGRDLGPALVEIHRLENDIDRLVRAAVAALFATGIDPLYVIRWKDVYESLESAADACETVANVLEGIALKRR
jgi:uncharacterized protein Yka (UPF0111/DUF47 family)